MQSYSEVRRLIAKAKNAKSNTAKKSLPDGSLLSVEYRSMSGLSCFYLYERDGSEHEIFSELDAARVLQERS